MKINMVATNSTYAGGLVGAVVALVSYGLTFVGWDMPVEVATSLTVLLSFVASSVIPDSVAQTNAAVEEHKK